MHMGAATQGLSKVAHPYGNVSCVQSGFRPPCRGTGQAPYRSTRQALRRKDEVLFMDADISFNPFWIPAPVSGHGAGSVSGYGAGLFARMTARQLWRPPVGIPTKMIQVPWGRRLYEIELVCIKLGESYTSWAEKFFQKTCPLRPSRPAQS